MSNHHPIYTSRYTSLPKNQVLAPQEFDHESFPVSHIRTARGSIKRPLARMQVPPERRKGRYGSATTEVGNHVHRQNERRVGRWNFQFTLTPRARINTRWRGMPNRGKPRVRAYKFSSVAFRNYWPSKGLCLSPRSFFFQWTGPHKRRNDPLIFSTTLYPYFSSTLESSLRWLRERQHALPYTYHFRRDSSGLD